MPGIAGIVLTRVDRRIGGLCRWTVVACAVTMLAAVTARAEAWPVIRPFLAAWFVSCAFYGSLAARSGAAVVEIGTIYVAVVILYLGFPLVGYLSNDLGFTSTNDLRLFLARPSPTEMGRIAWLYATHLLCFAVTYRAVRGSARFAPQIPRPARLRLILVLGLFLSIPALFKLLGLFYDLTAESYSEGYLVWTRVPLFVAQVASHLGGMRLTLEVALLILLCSDFRRYRGLVFFLLTVIGTTTFVKLGSRTEFVLVFGGAVVAYHWLVRPLSVRLFTIGASVLVFLFLVAGALRDDAFGADQGAGWNPLARGSEFESLFANAYDLEERRVAGELGPMPPTLLMSDLFALVPQQLFSGHKISPAVWYVTEFYPDYASKGGAFAFGTISEAIVGGGMPDVIARGVLLGAALALLHRWVSSRRRQFWPAVVYLWAALNVYQCFRVTTFYPAVLFWYRVIPVIVAVTVLERLSVRSTRSRPSALERSPIRVPPSLLSSPPSTSGARKIV